MVKRYPVRIGNWQPENNQTYSISGLIQVLRQSVILALQRSDRIGILLSGGLDSSILAILANEVQSAPCFTIGQSYDHPDVIAASRLAREFGFDLHIYIPSKEDSLRAARQIQVDYKGDDAVYLALEFASKHVTDIMAGDGIDEQMGGYWWHTHDSIRFTTLENTFKHFWDALEIDHLAPMFASAKRVGLNIHWVYLDYELVEYIRRIPLSERIQNGIAKAYWRGIAQVIGVPEWVINRPKEAFANALSRNTNQ